MTRSGRAVLGVEVKVVADLVEDALDDLVDDRGVDRGGHEMAGMGADSVAIR
jgi:hypothetical protein